MGTLYKRGNIWWLKYHRGGRPFYESSGSTVYDDAKNTLQQREGDIARGVPVTSRVNRCLIDELLADVVTDYTVNKRRSLSDLQRRIDLHLLPYFKGWKAAAITKPDVERYKVHRQGQKASNAQINRELAALKRAFTLGVDGSKILARPKIVMLVEDNARQGFFEREQFENVRAHLPAPLRPIVGFAFITGWRIRSEVLLLQWRQIDFTAGRVRLEPGTTKNKKGREFAFTRELRALLEAQKALTDALQREHGVIIPHVFHRKGKPISSFYRAWRSACKKAGVPGRIPHDFRRTAVRNLVRDGVSERVAMTMTGHKTREIFDRYDIVGAGDLDDAARRMDEAAERRRKGATVTETVTDDVATTAHVG